MAYDMVNWYIENRGFDDFEGDTRDHVLDLSSENFFEEMRKEAKGGDSLRITPEWRSAITDRIQNDAGKYFNDRVRDRINNSGLNLDFDVNDYDSLSEVDEEIEGLKEAQTYEDEYNELKQIIRSGDRDSQEYLEAEEDLTELTNKNVLRSIKGGRTKAERRFYDKFFTD